MGYLTPILFRNDSAQMLSKEPEQVIAIIKKAMSNHKDQTYAIHYRKPRKWWQFWKKQEWSGVDVNPIEALRTRHADENSVIVFYGNTWVDLSQLIYGKWEKDSETYLKYVEDCVKLAQSHLTDLKRVIKEKKNGAA